MKSKPRARRPYDSSGRQEQARATHEAIVAAALVRLRRIRPEELTYADLASDTGIAIRTVYRHFPTAEDLFAAALQKFLDGILGSGGLAGMSRPELAAALERFHVRLSAEPGLYRLFFSLPVRSGMGFAAIVKEFCRDTLAKIPAPQHDAVCAAIELQLGPYAWETFHTHWGVSPALITRTALTSVQALLDHFALHPDALAPGAELPAVFRDTQSSKKKANQKREPR